MPELRLDPARCKAQRDERALDGALVRELALRLKLPGLQESTFGVSQNVFNTVKVLLEEVVSSLRLSLRSSEVGNNVYAWVIDVKLLNPAISHINFPPTSPKLISPEESNGSRRGWVVSGGNRILCTGNCAALHGLNLASLLDVVSELNYSLEHGVRPHLFLKWLVPFIESVYHAPKVLKYPCDRSTKHNRVVKSCKAIVGIR